MVRPKAESKQDETEFHLNYKNQKKEPIESVHLSIILSDFLKKYKKRKTGCYAKYRNYH